MIIDMLFWLVIMKFEAANQSMMFATVNRIGRIVIPENDNHNNLNVLKYT